MKNTLCSLCFFLWTLSSCVTLKDQSKENVLPNLTLENSACKETDLPSQGGWSIVSCKIKNISKDNVNVKFAPWISTDDEHFILPSPEELQKLKQDLNKSYVSLPTASPIATSDRPEIFLFTALTSALNALNSAPKEFTIEGHQNLKPSDQVSFLFPLKKTEAPSPTTIDLKFDFPIKQTITVNLSHETASDVRKRAPAP